ncbi:MAG: hypothetical protein NTZ39_02610 [Methanoregula sp.]|nr:hypothetical protein [Methanoregula sp.]
MASNIPGVVRFINSPANLADEGIAVTDVLKEPARKKVCIRYDSINTKLIHRTSRSLSII